MPLAVETTDTSAILLLLAGLSGILLVLVLVLLVRRRRHVRREPRHGETPSLGDLTPAQITAGRTALESQQLGWLRRVADIGATIQLDEVLSRALAVAEEVPGVDAALVVIDPFEGTEQLVATVGTSASEGGILQPPMLPCVTGTRAVAVEYRYSDEREEDDGTLLREGLVLPLAVNDESVGSLAVFSRSTAGQADKAIERLEEIATRAAPAIRNAQRFKAMQALATLDPVSALHNRSFFDDTLEHETARGSRYGRPLALLIVDVGGRDQDGDHGSSVGPETTLVEFVNSIRGMLRAADVSCRVDTGQLAVILPESTVVDAEQLYRRLTHNVASGNAFPDGLHLAGGVTELSFSDTPASLFQRADRARARARQAGGGQLAVERAGAAEPPPEARAAG